MSESTGRKMGPREERWRRALDILDDRSLEIAQKHNEGVRPIIVRLRLADALEEALAVCSMEGRIRGSSSETMQTIARLQEVLAEVDRG